MTRLSTPRSTTVNAILSAFERIYIINLDSRPDRLREVTRELGRFNLLIDGARVTRLSAVRPSDPGEFPSIGARGCFMSHLGVFRDAIDCGVDSFLILEDDMRFADRVESPIPDPGAARFDILYGGHQALDMALLKGDAPLLRVPSDMAVMTAHCMGFRGPVIPCIAEFLTTLAARRGGDPQGGPMHVDGAYSWFRRLNPDVETLAFNPPVALQRPSRSDISAPKWFDRTPVARDVAAALRRLR